MQFLKLARFFILSMAFLFSAPILAQTLVSSDGVLKISVISDGENVRVLDENFVKNAPLAEVQALLRNAGLSDKELPTFYQVLLIETGDQKFLIDTGNGEFGAKTTGKLLENMAKKHILPQQITAILVTHFHGDHINGLRNKAGHLVFPNAKIYVPQPEWDFWMSAENQQNAPERQKNSFANVHRVFDSIAEEVIRFVPNEEVLPKIKSLEAFGHSPGHSAFIVDLGREKLLAWGDNIASAALFLARPDWAVMFDMDAEKAKETRYKLLEMAVREKMWVSGFHLPNPAIGRIEKVNHQASDEYRFVAQ